MVAQKAVELDPEAAETWKALGLVHRNKGNNTAAKEAYLQALGKNPNHSPAIGNLANIYAEEGDLVEAIRMYNESMDINPLQVLIYSTLVHCKLNTL